MEPPLNYSLCTSPRSMTRLQELCKLYSVHRTGLQIIKIRHQIAIHSRAFCEPSIDCLSLQQHRRHFTACAGAHIYTPLSCLDYIHTYTILSVWDHGSSFSIFRQRTLHCTIFWRMHANKSGTGYSFPRAYLLNIDTSINSRALFVKEDAVSIHIGYIWITYCTYAQRSAEPLTNSMILTISVRYIQKQLYVFKRVHSPDQHTGSSRRHSSTQQPLTESERS